MKPVFSMRLLTPLIIVSTMLIGGCQHDSTRELGALPTDIAVEGKFVNGLTWKDNLGVNFLITSQSEPSSSPRDPRLQSINVFVYHFISNSNSSRLLWSMKDAESDCQKDWDILAKIFKDGVRVTDLNNNGVSETWVVYKTICTSDVRPAKMRILMHEGKNKYTVSGLTKVPYGDGKFLGGEMVMDDSFLNASQVFKEYSRELWDYFVSNREW